MRGWSAGRDAIRAGALGALAGLLAACGGVAPDAAPPSELRPPIDHPADHRIFFRTEDLKHVVTLYDDGSYLFESGDDLGGVEAKREGRWIWEKKGSHQAELTLDRDVWFLTFAGYDSAFAVNESAPAYTRAFQFVRMEGRRGLGNQERESGKQVRDC
jgi:hypothetical protein